MKWAYFAIPIAMFVGGTLKIGEAVYEYKKTPEWNAIELKAKSLKVQRHFTTQKETDVERVRRVAHVQPDVKIVRVEGVHVYLLEKNGHYVNIIVQD